MLLYLAEACSVDCPVFKSPCPAHFNVAAFCGDMNCTLEGMPTSCSPESTLGCPVARGKVLSIPIANFASQLAVHDLQVEVFNTTCDGLYMEPKNFTATIDGVAGVPFKYAWRDGFETVFRWQPFPSSPGVLAIRYDDPSVAACFDVALNFVDATCESQHPQPECPK